MFSGELRIEGGGLGAVERQLAAIDEGWLNQEIGRRRKAGSVCVRLTLHRGSDVDFSLLSCGCQGGGGGGRPLTPAERRLEDLWVKRGLRDCDFTGGQVIAFLHQLSRAAA